MSAQLAPHEAASAMLEAMLAAGVHPLDRGTVAAELLRGELIRFRCEGDRGPNGWARLYLDERPAGTFGNWRLDVKGNWRAGDDVALTPGYLAAIAARRERERKALMARYRAAAGEAERQWRAARSAKAEHGYLAAKGLGDAACLPNVRQHGADLLIPLHDENGALWSLQRIAGDGAKRSMAGGCVDGCFWRAGKLASGAGLVAVGEGWATMAAVHLASGVPVAAAMTAGNLHAVAVALAKRYPAGRLILCADMDAGPAGNIGLLKAHAAANAVTNALLARPSRPADWPDAKGWDFADTFKEPNGADLIRRALGLSKG